VIAGAVSGPPKQAKNDAESDRWLKSDTKSGTSGFAAAEVTTAGRIGQTKSFEETRRLAIVMPPEAERAKSIGPADLLFEKRSGKRP
jgi:hypothetical protein